ncbi:hypothetical protein C8R43DRAFT_960055 [Mycena crocata]|nr:hypothetical protein C8R43DRAFT_960055 [Mycena crocata]
MGDEMELETTPYWDNCVQVVPYRRQAPVPGVVGRVVGVRNHLLHRQIRFRKVHRSNGQSKANLPLMKLPSLVIPQSGVCTLNRFPRTCRCSERMNQLYLPITTLGLQASNEHCRLTKEFRRVYPWMSPARQHNTPEFARDSDRLCGALAATFGVLVIREHIRDDALRAAHAAALRFAQAVAELMTDDYVEAWGDLSTDYHWTWGTWGTGGGMAAGAGWGNWGNAGWGHGAWGDQPRRHPRQSDRIRPGTRNMGRTHRQHRNRRIPPLTYTDAMNGELVRPTHLSCELRSSAILKIESSDPPKFCSAILASTSTARRSSDAIVRGGISSDTNPRATLEEGEAGKGCPALGGSQRRLAAFTAALVIIVY